MGALPKTDFNKIPKIPEGKRIIPNDMARSSLFTVVNKTIQRDYFHDKEISSYPNCCICYTGHELRSDDQDVWMQLLLTSYKSNNLEITFSPYTFIKALSWPARPAYKEKLLTVLKRLASATLNITNKAHNEGVVFSLVRRFEWITDENSSRKKWVVHLEPEMLKIFGDLGKTYSYISWSQRIKLKPLAKWLHIFYSTHAKPQAIHIDKIKKLCGSKMKNDRQFKIQFRKSILELVQVGFLEPTSFIGPNNLVYVERKGQNNLMNIIEFK